MLGANFGKGLYIAKAYLNDIELLLEIENLKIITYIALRTLRYANNVTQYA
jgi:hypothetical protein